MQIVIDMSDDDYRKVQDGRASVSMMRKIIRNGTPLPKGHGRLIDAEELEECKEIMNNIMGESKYAVRMDDVRNMQTIIESENEGAEE